MDMIFRNDEAEELRIKYKYRRLLVQGRVVIPYPDAARLIGPDSAYRLYGTQKKFPGKKFKSPDKNKSSLKE